MKIIRYGNWNADDTVYNYNCYRCGCQFEFTDDDLKPAGYNGEHKRRYQMFCPQCNSNIVIVNLPYYLKKKVK